VPASAEGIAKSLAGLLTDPGKREKVASSFRVLVSQRYTWDRIVKEYLHLYKGLLNESGSKEV
jgi:glycosyltransferase involved in cell wall biosynthesis